MRPLSPEFRNNISGLIGVRSPLRFCSCGLAWSAMCGSGLVKRAPSQRSADLLSNMHPIVAPTSVADHAKLKPNELWLDTNCRQADEACAQQVTRSAMSSAYCVHECVRRT